MTAAGLGGVTVEGNPLSALSVMLIPKVVGVPAASVSTNARAVPCPIVCDGPKCVPAVVSGESLSEQPMAAMRHAAAVSVVTPLRLVLVMGLLRRCSVGVEVSAPIMVDTRIASNT